MMGYRRPPSLRINATSQPSAENSEVLTLLRELSAKVDAIKAWQDTRQIRDSANDLAVLGQLLPAIGGRFGSRIWKVSEIT